MICKYRLPAAVCVIVAHMSSGRLVRLSSLQETQLARPACLTALQSGSVVFRGGNEHAHNKACSGVSMVIRMSVSMDPVQVWNGKMLQPCIFANCSTHSNTRCWNVIC